MAAGARGGEAAVRQAVKGCCLFGKQYNRARYGVAVEHEVYTSASISSRALGSKDAASDLRALKDRSQRSSSKGRLRGAADAAPTPSLPEEWIATENEDAGTEASRDLHTLYAHLYDATQYPWCNPIGAESTHKSSARCGLRTGHTGWYSQRCG